MSAPGINFGYSIGGVLKCSQQTCSDNNTLMIVLLAIGIALGFLLVTSCILGMLFLWGYRRPFGFIHISEMQTIKPKNAKTTFGSIHPI